METTLKTIAVAICTRKESGSLWALVDQVLAQTTPKGWGEAHVMVILNQDVLCSEFSDNFPRTRVEDSVRVTVFREPRVGIPFARNMALDQAISLEFDWIAFLDDDCVPDKRWLYELCLASEEFQADCVAGAWDIRPTSQASSWVPEGIWGRGSYVVDNRPAEHGFELPYAFTRSVLLKTLSLENAKTEKSFRLRFDPDYAETGGSDILFFTAFRRLGGRIVFCANSLVVESFSGNRLRLSWHLRRRLRDSHLFLDGWKIRDPEARSQRLKAWFLDIFHGTALAATHYFRRDRGTCFKQRVGHLALQATPLFGAITWLLGFQYQFYSSSWTFRWTKSRADRLFRIVPVETGPSRALVSRDETVICTTVGDLEMKHPAESSK